MNKICGIYKITSPKNRIYIGQSIDIFKRFKEYKKLRCKAQCLLFRSLKKYGVENHKFEVLNECKKESLDELEVFYIKLYNCFNRKSGLNLKLGGGRGQAAEHSNETKKKISIANSGRKLSEEHKAKFTFKGRHHSDDTKSIMSECMIGPKNHRYGKKVSKKTRLKRSKSIKETYKNNEELILMRRERMIGEKHPNFGKKTPIEIREKISKSNMGRKFSKSFCKKLSKCSKNKKKVIQFDVNGNKIKKWDSIKQASKYMGVKKQSISSACHGRLKTCKGYIWKFK